MSDIRTRLIAAISVEILGAGYGEAADAVLEVLRNPSDADVERVARAIDPNGWAWLDRASATGKPLPTFLQIQLRNARAAIRALVAGGSE